MTRLLACLALLLAPLSASAGAAFYGVNVGGVVNYISPRLDDGTFELGEEVFLFFRIDASVPDGEPAAEIGVYEGAVSDRFLDIGGDQYTASTGLLFMRNAQGAPNADEFYVDGDLFGPTVAGLAPGNSIFSVIDTTRQVFSDDSVPSSLDLADFDLFSLQLFFPEDTTNHAVQLTVTSLSYLPVSEPARALLAVAGALTLGALRRTPRGPRARAAP